MRTLKTEIRARTLAAIKRIVEAEAAASGAPKPRYFSVLSEFPPTVNDAEAMGRVATAFEMHFGADQVRQMPPIAASEDFSLFGTAWGVPVVHWFVGGVDRATFEAAAAAGKLDELPSNHAPNFAPVIHPTLHAGVEALLTAAGVWLAADAS